MNLPAHKCGLYLTHNAHKDVYETVAQFVEDLAGIEEDFESPTAMQRAIDTNELWILQWYPETPIGFLRLAAPTLEELLRRARWEPEARRSISTLPTASEIEKECERPEMLEPGKTGHPSVSAGERLG